MNRVVVHYHEIALKKGNRRHFISLLIKNIRQALRGTGVRKVRSLPGRVVINLKSSANWPEIQERLARVFGIVNYALAIRVERCIDEIEAATVTLAAAHDFESFAIRTRRADKTFPLRSMEIDRRIGSAVQESSGARVDLSNPGRSFRIQILPNEAFVSTDRFRGPGGLPTGSGGRVLTLLSGGIDSPVAAHRMMKRGCELDFIHFHGAPYQDNSSLEKVAELTKILTQWQLESRLHTVKFGAIQKEIVTQVPRRFRVVLYRRMMMRIAEALAAQLGAKALVTGESLGQVASQTLENLSVAEEVLRLPLLRPLIGMDKSEITAEAERIGTFEISILPDQDCCQLFVPKHPATRMTSEQARDAEESLDIDRLVEQALESVPSEEYHFPKPRVRKSASTEQLENGELELNLKFPPRGTSV